MNRLLTTIAIVTLGATTMQGQWTQAPGPSGGSVRALAAQPGGLVAALQYGRVHRYSEQTGRWQQLDDAQVNRLDGVGSAIVASTDLGLTRSTDAGASWSSTGPSGAMVVDSDGGTLYAVDDTRLHRSSDGGASWQAWVELGPNAQSVATIGDVVLVGVYEEPGFVRSTNGGANWRIVSEGLPRDAWPTSMSRAGGAIYASMRTSHPHANHGIYRSLDSGRTWSEYNEGIPGDLPGGHPWIFDLVADDSTIVAAAATGLYRLENGVWRRLTTAIALATVVDDEGITIGTGGGIRRYERSTGTWSALDAGLDAADVRAVLSTGESILVGTVGGAHRSSDRGATWSDAIGEPVAQLASVGGVVLARVDPYDTAGLRRSTDDGRTWTSAVNGIADPRRAIRTIVTTPAVAYVGLHEIAGIGGGGIEWRAGGIYRSLDGGATWSAINSGLPRSGDVPAPVVHLAADGDAVVAATTGGLYYSRDQGATWLNAQFDPWNGYVSSLGAHDGIFYLTAGSRIWRSTNQGATWALFEEGVGNAPITGFDVVGDAILARSPSSEPRGFYRLDGDRWVAITGRLPAGVVVSSLALHGTALVAGTHDAGVWLGPADIVAGIDDETRTIASSVRPNPARERAELTLRLEETDDAALEIVDAIGRRVERRELGRLPAGEQTITLDLATLPAGIYHYRVLSTRVLATGSLVRR